MKIGVVADTHGYLDPRVLPLLAGVDQILHAGDIGRQSVIEQLARLAPVTAVQGNVDAGTALGRQYPVVQRLCWADVEIYLTHVGGDPARLVQRLPAPRPQVYIFGHSHQALLATYEGVLFLNPGAAGRPRFGGGVSIALLELTAGLPTAHLVPL